MTTTTKETKDAPPSILTKHSSSPSDKDSVKASARTPKHANTREDASGSHPPQSHPYPHPPRDYRYEQGHPRGAPYSPQHYGYRRDMPTVSPGAPNYNSGSSRGAPYYGGDPRDDFAAHQQHYGRYDSRYGDFPQPPQGAPYPPNQPPPYRGAGYEPRYYSGRPPYRPTPDGHPGQPFSRAVSSSFDRSIKSRNEPGAEKGTLLPMPPAAEALPKQDGASLAPSDDSSWKQLNQVESVDEAELQRRIAEKKQGRNIQVNIGSNSSSLTNSPNDGANKAEADESKLGSLSTVASREEPLETIATTKPKEPSSPGSSAGSLDLLKCHSGSSGLLHGFREPSTSLDVTEIVENNNKRSREERGDADTLAKEGGERDDTQKKHKKDDEDKSTLAPRESPGTFFDKAPLYSYSMDSVGARLHTQRPPSSSSSTITPMERNHDGVGPSLPSWDIQPQDSFGNGSATGGGLMGNFSFSNDYPMLSASGSNLGYDVRPSRGGPPAVTAESRNQSFDGYNHFDDNYRPPYPPQGHPQENYKKHHQHQGPFPPQAPSWGTTQSTGASHHYRPPPFHQYRNGPPPPPSHHPYNNGPMMSRNYSEDASRTSPPGPHARSSFQPPPEFAAPHNPHLNRRPPPAVYIMSTSAGVDPSVMAKSRPGSGVYSWTKEDDVRLNEVMKKYKSPRDWEPIAQEHGRGKTAKECHERWIRYLKPGVRKGQWQDYEDAIVVEAVTTSTEQPFTRWSDLAQRLPGRVGKQIRDRWVNHLNPNINHMPFSREDDLLLWEGHKKLGKRWVEISTKYFNSSRSENHIKNRWYSASFKKFISNEFGSDAYNGGKSSSAKKADKNNKAPKREHPTIKPIANNETAVEAV